MSKTCTSSNWADINAIPDPIAILIEIKSEKFVEKNNVKNIPIVKPKYTTFLQLFFHKIYLQDR